MKYISFFQNPLWQLASAAVLVAVLTGCATSVDRTYANTGGPTGFVALTYTETGLADWFISPTVHFRGVADTAVVGTVGRDFVDGMIGPSKYLLSDERPRLDTSVTAANPSGFPVVLELPVGEYEFYRYYGMKSVPHGLHTRTTTLQSKNPFHIRFSVKPQTVTYIGNLNFDYDGVGVRLRIMDHSARDLPVIQKGVKEVSGKAVTVDIARSVQ